MLTRQGATGEGGSEGRERGRARGGGGGQDVIDFLRQLANSHPVEATALAMRALFDPDSVVRGIFPAIPAINMHAYVLDYLP